MERRYVGFTTFPEAPRDQEPIAAVLVTKDADGQTRTWVRTYDEYQPPSDEALGFLGTATDIANL